MTNSWRIETQFPDAWNNMQKQAMRQERRPAITNATQILGPGAGPFAILLQDWNDEGATFNGIFYSEPGAFNAPGPAYDSEDDTTWRWWLGETFGTQDEDGLRYGFQRLTRFRLLADGPGDWDEFRRRFYPQGDLITYSDWEAV